MNRKQQEESFNAFVDKQRNTLLSKGDDYAGDDRLSNFKQVGSITGQTAAQACLTLIATKVARLSQLLGGKSPKNESIQDSVLDLGTYASLLNMLLEEENPRVTKEMIGPDAAELFCKATDVNKNRFNLTDSGRKGWPKTDSQDESFSAFLRRVTGDPNGGQGKCDPIPAVMLKAEVPKKKKKVKTYKAEDGVVTFKADSIEDALKQLEARGIKVPNGMMLGCIGVK